MTYIIIKALDLRIDNYNECRVPGRDLSSNWASLGQSMKRQMAPPSPTLAAEETVSLSVIIFLVMISSILGNLIIILVIVKVKRLLSSFANKLVLSLAVSDLTTACFPVNYQLAIALNITLISNEGVLCTIGGLASYAIFLTSILTKVMLSIDRFIALGHPLKYNLRIKSSLKAFMVVYPWIHGILFGVFCGILIDIKFDPASRDCGLVWRERHLGFTLSVLIAHFVLPFGMLVVMNTMTLRLVRSQNRVLVRQESSTRDIGTTIAGIDRLSRRRAGSETKLAKMSMAIVLAFLLSWTPYIITRALSIYCCHVPSIVLRGAVITADLTSLINPIIYSSLRSDLRQAIRDLFRRHNVMQVHPVSRQVSNQKQTSQISEC